MAKANKLAKQYFPKFPREIILTTEQPFIQAIHEMLIFRWMPETK